MAVFALRFVYSLLLQLAEEGRRESFIERVKACPSSCDVSASSGDASRTRVDDSQPAA